jgi:HEAT repeat protein
MIDDKDLTESTLRRILWDALKEYSVDQLFELIKDKDCIVRTSAAKRLQLIGGDKVFYEIKKLVESEYSEVREISAFILGQLGTPNKSFKNDTIPILTSLSNDENIDVRIAAIYALGHLGDVNEYTDPVLIDILKKAAEDMSDDVRLSAAFLISSFKLDAEILNILSKLKRDHNFDVSEYAELSEEIYIDDKNERGQ